MLGDKIGFDLDSLMNRIMVYDGVKHTYFNRELSMKGESNLLNIVSTNIQECFSVFKTTTEKTSEKKFVNDNLKAAGIYRPYSEGKTGIAEEVFSYPNTNGQFLFLKFNVARICKTEFRHIGAVISSGSNPSTINNHLLHRSAGISEHKDLSIYFNAFYSNDLARFVCSSDSPLLVIENSLAYSFSRTSNVQDKNILIKLLQDDGRIINEPFVLLITENLTPQSAPIDIEKAILFLSIACSHVSQKLKNHFIKTIFLEAIMNNEIVTKDWYPGKDENREIAASFRKEAFGNSPENKIVVSFISKELFQKLTGSTLPVEFIPCLNLRTKSCVFSIVLNYWEGDLRFFITRQDKVLGKRP